MSTFEIVEPDKPSSTERVIDLSPSTELKPHLLPLHKVKQVDKWTPYIVMWIEEHKRFDVARIRINCQALGMAVETAKGRCQSAIKAFVDKDVFNSAVDVEILSKIRLQYKVIEYELDGHIIICPRQKTDVKANAIVSRDTRVTLRTQQPNFERMIIGLAAMLQAKVLIGGATIIGMLDPELKLRLESEFKRAFRQVEQNEHDML